MGEDKALVDFNGAPMIEYILRQVEGWGGETFVITNNAANYPDIGIPLYPDVVYDIGALGGIYSALHHAMNERVLLLACDMPFVSLPVLGYLLGLAPDFDIVIPKLTDEDHEEPFRAVYSRACLPHIQNCIDRGDRRVRSFFDAVNTRYVHAGELEPLDPGLTTFLNVNTPGDLDRARRIAAHRPD
jgi:molybdopterin-guanine dinucleotide biosynthesis protein A